ncbi:C-glycoside deglycosidase beta subunit domain-containing protein, partial [Mycobacterium tuberculosis]
GLQATGEGLRLAMRLPWYRSLPFSVVEIGEVTLDGQPLDLSAARIEFDGQSWPLAENGEQTNRFWFVRDSAFLVVPARPLAPGSQHEVALTLYISPPY